MNLYTNQVRSGGRFYVPDSEMVSWKDLVMCDIGSESRKSQTDRQVRRLIWRGLVDNRRRELTAVTKETLTRETLMVKTLD